MNKNVVKFKIDTGTDVNAPPLSAIVLSFKNLQPIAVKLFGPGNQRLQRICEFLAKIQHDRQSVHDDVYVVSNFDEPLLGREASAKLGLVAFVKSFTTETVQDEPRCSPRSPTGRQAL